MNALYAYFAYGSNLLPARLLQRCPTAVPYAPAILPNYRLTERLYAMSTMRRGNRFMGLSISSGRMTWRVLTATRDIRRFTAVTTVDVILGDGTALPALIYEMTPKTKEIRNGLPYPEEYRKICREGGESSQNQKSFYQKKEAQMKKETVLIAAYGTLRSANAMNVSAGMPFSAEAQQFPGRSMTRGGDSRHLSRMEKRRSQSN